MGIALASVIIGALNFFHIPITKNNLLLAIFSGCAIAILRLFHKRPKIEIKRWLSRDRNLNEILVPLSFSFILLILRVVQIRDAIVPNWYDGLIHTYLLQEFTSMSVIPFDALYHVGFHALTMVVHFFWELTLPETILVSGQWLSFVCGMSFYILARRYTRDPYAAGLSSVIYSFVLLFPTLLTSWSHYPYILGLALLPLAILTTEDWLNGERISVLEPLLLVISLTLTHYGLLVIWLAFILAYSVNQIIFRKKSRWKVVGSCDRIFFRPFSLLFPISIIILSSLFDLSNHEVRQDDMLSHFYTTDLGFSVQYVFRLFHADDNAFIFLSILWALWAVIRNRRLLYVTLLWPLATWSIIWLQHQVMGSSILTYTNLIVLLSIPLSLSVGLIAKQIIVLLIKQESSDPLPSFRHRMKSRSYILISIAMLVGVFNSPLSIDQRTSLFSNEDMLAMRWISDHTTKDSGFLIRSVSWGNTALIPSDGGGWIPFLTGRQAIIPETGELYDICEFAEAHGINYLYFGKERGNDQFDVRLSDLDMDSYVLVYGSPTVEIVSLHCG